MNKDLWLVFGISSRDIHRCVVCNVPPNYCVVSWVTFKQDKKYSRTIRPGPLVKTKKRKKRKLICLSFLRPPQQKEENAKTNIFHCVCVWENGLNPTDMLHKWIFGRKRREREREREHTSRNKMSFSSSQRVFLGRIYIREGHSFDITHHTHKRAILLFYSRRRWPEENGTGVSFPIHFKTRLFWQQKN